MGGPLYLMHSLSGISRQDFQGFQDKGQLCGFSGLLCLLAGLCRLAAVRDHWGFLQGARALYIS